MDIQFISLDTKLQLLKSSTEKGNEKEMMFAVTEINRLESIIKDYEIAMRHVVDKLGSSTFKQPSKY